MGRVRVRRVCGLGGELRVHRKSGALYIQTPRISAHPTARLSLRTRRSHVRTQQAPSEALVHGEQLEVGVVGGVGC